MKLDCDFVLYASDSLVTSMRTAPPQKDDLIVFESPDSEYSEREVDEYKVMNVRRYIWLDSSGDPQQTCTIELLHMGKMD